MIEGSYCHICVEACLQYQKEAESMMITDFGRFAWEEANLSPCDYCNHYGSIICPDTAKSILYAIKITHFYLTGCVLP